MKKIQLWIMVAVIALVLLCAGAASAEIIASGDCGAKGDNVTWTLDSEGLLSIAGTGAMESLEDFAFLSPTDTLWNGHQNEIKLAFISDGVTSIGDGAFYNCYRLTSIAIPDSVTKIGDGAFGICSRLTSIAIPDSVTSIGDGAFASCDSLTSIAIPDSVTSIGTGAFSDCDSLTSIVIPDTVTSIGDLMFSHCNNLTSIVIPDSVASIGYWAFDGCRSLTSIDIPDSVTSIGSFAIRDNTLIYCHADSYAEKWAQNNGMGDNVRYLDP